MISAIFVSAGLSYLQTSFGSTWKQWPPDAGQERMRCCQVWTNRSVPVVLHVGYLNDVARVKTWVRLTMWQARYMISPPDSSWPANTNFVICIPSLLFNNHGSECCNSDIPCTARQSEYYNKNNLELGPFGRIAGDSGCPGCDTA